MEQAADTPSCIYIKRVWLCVVSTTITPSKTFFYVYSFIGYKCTSSHLELAKEALSVPSLVGDRSLISDEMDEYEKIWCCRFRIWAIYVGLQRRIACLLVPLHNAPYIIYGIMFQLQI